MSHSFIALFAVTGSIKKLFSTDYVDIYLFSIYLPKDFQYNFLQDKIVGLPYTACIVIPQL